ncbi:CBS domain-containing protein [Thermomonas fusca]|uniref:CBS domain-containing protein n=1 Tax=Thermomonas fusca TaxID=215690 RepID=A0A5R9PF21_9GAMM|nr:CBS domain-containing protein [Thermomonas fusca]TLX21982.1 CBS domain-containing protein [Thermomonas fusca]
MQNVSSIMTSNPAFCRIDTPLHAVARLMIDNDCGGIPVVDMEGKPLGFVTDRDVAVRIVATGHFEASSIAGDAMSAPCKTVNTNTSLQECTKLMESEKIRRVPIVDDDGRLSGIVSIADLALAGKDSATAEVVSEVSKPGLPH